MFYKIFNEPGEFLDSEGQTQNLVSCVRYVPANSDFAFGWTEFDSELDAMEHHSLTKIPTHEEVLELVN